MRGMPILAVILGLLPGLAGAQSAGGFVTVPGVKSVKPTRTAPPPEPAALPPDAAPDVPLFLPGDVLPPEYLMLFDVRRYGLPTPRDGWVYFTVGADIYKVLLNSRIVVERMDVKAE